MAAPSTTPSTSSRQQNSRFSTLKVFKFASSSRPPPPPPKDPYYLANPSLASLSQSLSPESSYPSQPVTPVSAQYANSARSPSPTPSNAPSRVMSPPNAALSPGSAGSRRGLFKLPSFTKRPKTPKSAKTDTSDESLPPDPVDGDGNISSPWNFQHNIHVDEAFTGLPPTWSASLSQMGFSDEEIAAINTKRAASRPSYFPPSSSSSSAVAASRRVRSPSPTSSAHSGVVARPKPRSSSLRRDASNTSLSQTSDSSIHSSTHSRNPSRSRVLGRQGSDVSLGESLMSSATQDYLQMNGRGTGHAHGRSLASNPSSSSGASTVLISPRTQGGNQRDTIIAQRLVQSPELILTASSPPWSQSQTTQSNPSTSNSYANSNSGSGSGSSEKDPRPRTPPRRYHIANDSISTISSPPPAYSNSPKRRDRSLDEVVEILGPGVSRRLPGSMSREGTPRSSESEEGDDVRVVGRGREPVHGSTGIASTSVSGPQTAASASSTISAITTLPSSTSQSSSRIGMGGTSSGAGIGGGLAQPATVITRLSAMKAPRLSLRQESLADLSSWSESLFSFLPGDGEGGEEDTPIATSPPMTSATSGSRPMPTKSRTLPLPVVTPPSPPSGVQIGKTRSPTVPDPKVKVSSSASSTFTSTPPKASKTSTPTSNSTPTSTPTKSPTPRPMSTRQVPPQKPVPLDKLPARSNPLPPMVQDSKSGLTANAGQPVPGTPSSLMDGSAPLSTTPLWDEVMSMVRDGDGDSVSGGQQQRGGVKGSMKNSSPRGPRGGTAQLAPHPGDDEGQQLRVPPSPSYSISTSGSGSPGLSSTGSASPGLSEISHSPGLGLGLGREKENRDSSMSTMTVTPATIVRHVSVARRARANVIQSPAREVGTPVGLRSAGSAGSGERERVGGVEGERERERERDRDGAGSPQSSESASSESVSTSAALSSSSTGHTSPQVVPSPFQPQSQSRPQSHVQAQGGKGQGRQQGQGKPRPPNLMLNVDPGTRSRKSSATSVVNSTSSSNATHPKEQGGATGRSKSATNVANTVTTIPYVESSPNPSPRKTEFERGLTSRGVRQIRDDEEGMAGVQSPPTVSASSQPRSPPQLRELDQRRRQDSTSRAQHQQEYRSRPAVVPTPSTAVASTSTVQVKQPTSSQRRSPDIVVDDGSEKASLNGGVPSAKTSPSVVIPSLSSSRSNSNLAVSMESSSMSSSITATTISSSASASTSVSTTSTSISTSGSGSISISTSSTSTSAMMENYSPMTPAPRYPGWVIEVVKPLQDFILEYVDPREMFGDLTEIAEGESGSVYSARVLRVPTPPPTSHPSRRTHLPTASTSATAIPTASPSTSPNNEDQIKLNAIVAIKQVALLPSGSQKLVDLERELKVMKRMGRQHTNILSMDAVYVDTVDDALWIRMEIMDRSLADVVVLVEDDLVLEEGVMGQVASDVLSALVYLQKVGIAHRDVRSDNLLVNSNGVVKLADFSNAVKVSPSDPVRSDPVGVPYWQAPEIRSGSYNALKVDVWSLGATIWEMAEAQPPFSDATDASQLKPRWPRLSRHEEFTRSFHDFLHLCSEPSSTRPQPLDLLNTPFIRNASGRTSIAQVLNECRSIEGGGGSMSRRQSSDSQGTISVSS